DFWYHAVWNARKLRRGELFVAKNACDGYLKALVLRMLGWRAAAATPGTAAASSSSGPTRARSMPSAAPRVLRGGGRRACSMDLFAWLARETCGRLRVAYPDEEEPFARVLVRDVLS